MTLLDLFSGAPPVPRSTSERRSRSAAASSSSAGRSRRRGADRINNSNNTNDNNTDTLRAASEEDRKLFTSCVAQVQRNLKAHASSPSTLHTLASYYTKVQPFIEDRPFCVSLSYATFLFHLQMARISVMDVELYVQLIAQVMSQLSDDERQTHPFVQQVLRDHVFGLPSPTCKGGAHCVVLIPPSQYRAFSSMATALIALDVVPIDMVYQFQDKLESYCNAASPIVANRALALLVQSVSQVRIDEQVTALQYVLRTKPVKFNIDFLLACYERLKRAVVDPANGPTFGRAISIHCSELFLRFRSPIRREYVERFLYPSLCHPDMADFLAIPATRQHLFTELLSLCTPGMATVSPYYACICALLQQCFDDEIDGALEVVTLINCRMPHAAYFMSALAVDSHMAVSMFAKVIIALARGAGLAMTGRDVPDEVANSINKRRTSVYNVLFLLREVVRSCSVTASRRASDMLKALRVAVPITTIEALGKLSSEAFDGLCDITVDPQLLCAELAMVLHHQHIEDAMDSSVDYFKNVTQQCPFCGMQRSEALLCPVNGTVHVCGQTSVSRVLSTLAECAGAKVVEEKLIKYMRDPTMQMESAVHFLVYHILANSGQHRNALFVSLEPYIRNTLMALVNADRGSVRGLIGSEMKANALMLHVKLITLLASSVDPSYLESILRVFSELKLRNNHDALALWLMGNVLLRNCKGIIDILPTDPLENNYCVDFPGCAPSSATCADNAQLVLKLLDRAHTFSQETKKLVGCCVCKLIQDFNMQTPNIISSLLSSHGFIPVGLPSLNEFALPVGQGSTFWSFFLQQMKSSAPARTAFMVGLAKSMSRRFRIANPAEAVSLFGVEATGHPFTVMMYEAMKRSPPLARVVLFMVSNWMRQPEHPPGKFVCLVYICVQLITVVMTRGEGQYPVEVEAETHQDRFQFDDSVRKAAKLLKGQQNRLEKLAPAARRDSLEFYQLVRKLQRGAVRCVAQANGEPLPDDMEYDVDANAANVTASSGDTAMALEELHNAADDSIFDEGEYVGDMGGADDDDDSYNAEERSQQDYNNQHQHYQQQQQQNVSAQYVNSSTSSSSAPRQPPSILKTSSAKKRHADAHYHLVDDDEAPHHWNNSSADDIHARNDTYTQNSQQQASYATRRDYDEENNHDYRRQHNMHDQQQQHTPAPQRPTSSTSIVHTHQRTRSHDKGVTAPFDRSIGTSPIIRDMGVNTTMDSVASPPSKQSTDVPGSAVAQTPRVTTGDGSWQEPDLMAYVQGDETPIEDRDVPHLQSTAARHNNNGDGGGVVLPSGLVLEYLRTHQALDSLRHELNQLEGENLAPVSSGGLTAYAQQYATDSGRQVTTMEVTVEARANNYGVPHDSAQPLAGRTVRMPVQMVSTTAHRSTHRQQQQQQQYVYTEEHRHHEEHILDGEESILPVSEDPTAKQHAKRRRRTEIPSSDHHHHVNVNAREEEEEEAVAAVPQTPSANFRGRNFFLQQQNQRDVVSSTLQDLRYMQRQRDGMETIAQQQGNEENVNPGASPHAVKQGGGLMMSPTTPYGQVILPTCFVEQKNDTTMRELRQVMGAYDPNDTRLTRSGKSRIRGSGTPAPTATTATAAGEDATGGRSSSAWWTEMSAAPMPTYAADPQYSMELF